MAETGFFQGQGGAIVLLDIPPAPEGDRGPTPARELFDQKVEKGELIPVPEEAVEEYVIGTEVSPRDNGLEVTYTGYRLKAAAETPKRTRKPKADEGE